MMQLLSIFLLLSAAVLSTSAQLFQPDAEAPRRNLNISVNVNFPDDVRVRGTEASPLIVVNGIPKKVNVTIVNNEEDAISVYLLAGSLWDPTTGINVRNLTQQFVNIEMPKGETADFLYTILLDMHPRHLRLNLEAVLQTADQTLITTAIYDSIVWIVEQPMSLLDPQLLFLYLILLSCIVGTGYWAYNYWLDTVNPKRKRGPRTATQPARVESTAAAASGVDGKRFDESWIPEHHIKRATSPKSRGRASK